MMKKALLLLALAILTPPMAMAQEMYAEYNGYGLLKFYYDDKKASRDGTVYDLQKDVSEIFPGYPPMPEWFFSEDHQWQKNVGFVVIDPSFDKARPTSAIYMFADFENLTKIEGMEYLHTEKVTNMYGMFCDSKSLTAVDVSHLDTRNVTDMNSMFDKCRALETLDVSHFDVSQVEDMSFMFRACEKLASLNVSGWDTQNVIGMSSMFTSCSTLTELDVSNFDTRNVEHMDRMFANCYKLNTLDLRSFDMSNVSSATEMFSICRYLSAIYCNDDWSETSALTAESSAGMFHLCDDLTGGNGTRFDMSNKNDITYARPDTDNTPGYFTAKRSVTADPQAGYVVYTDDDKTLTFYYDDRIDSREGVAYGMNYVTVENFGYSLPEWSEIAGSVEHVVFDASYAAARPQTMNFWFYFMARLVSVENLEFLNTSAVTSMMGTFAYCAYLQSIDLSHFSTAAVTNMAYMFAGCSTLSSLDLTRFSMKSVTSVNGLFSGCLALRTIYCNDDWAELGIGDDDYMFDYCEKLIGKGEGNTCPYDSEKSSIELARPCTADTPGYFTAKPVVKTNSADVNGDGTVDVADIASVIAEMAASARIEH